MEDFRSLWARRHVRQTLFEEITELMSRNLSSLPLGLQGPPPSSPFDLPPDPVLLSSPSNGLASPALPEGSKVCIIGAGVSGLYIARLLDRVKIPYDILEASDRVGGRMYTHEFSKTSHDYYDVGAMRYPQIPIMKRTFDLFRDMKLTLVDYYLNGENCPQRFNDRTILSSKEADPFRVSIRSGGNVPNNVVDHCEDILKEVFAPYKKGLKENFEKGFEKLCKMDEYSTREYLKRMPGPDGAESKNGFNFYAIQWMETRNTSTGLFDQAFSESVMDSFDFDYPLPPDPEDPKHPLHVKWSCIEGGTEKLTDAMVNAIKGPIHRQTRVTSIRHNKESGDIDVYTAGNSNPTAYQTVFNTTSLGCLQRMDLTHLDLHPTQKDAIRSLHYDHSVKVAIKFKSAWWITKCNITKGGCATTDLPLRTCIYPSYNIHDDPEKPAVLLVSYTWAQDASRMASLVHNQDASSSDPDSPLIELILYNLWRLHGDYISSVDELKEAYLEHHAYSWSNDPNQAGAFALFGPGQFQNLYPYLTRPAADSKFHIVGEASSAHHAWIVGALNSAVTAVHRFLKRFRQWESMQILEEEFGIPDELEPGVYGTEHLQVALGMLKKGEHVTIGS